MTTKCIFDDTYDLVVDKNIFTLQTKETTPIPYMVKDRIQSMLEVDSILKRIIKIDKDTLKKIHSRKYSKSVILFSTPSIIFLSPTKEIFEESFDITQESVRHEGGFPICVAKQFILKEGTYILDSFLHLLEEKIKITFTEEVQKGFLDTQGNVFYHTITNESISVSSSYTYENLKEKLIQTYYAQYKRQRK
jgi:hypothetical protein